METMSDIKAREVNASDRQRVYALNKLRFQQGWYDRIWNRLDFRGSQTEQLLAGGVVVAENENCAARYQLTPCGDLLAVLVSDKETKCIVFNRITGEKHVDFLVKETETDG